MSVPRMSFHMKKYRLAGHRYMKIMKNLIDTLCVNNMYLNVVFTTGGVIEFQEPMEKQEILNLLNYITKVEEIPDELLPSVID